MTAPSDLCHDSWPLLSCQVDGGCSHLANLDPDLREAIEHSAIEDLWRWSGRRFGLCPVSVRPCAADCLSGSYSAWGRRYENLNWGLGMYPVISGGQWFNVICGRCNTSRCACTELSTIVLPGPAYEIVEVLVDGVALSSADYRLDNLGLSRLDGGSWPRCQSMQNDPYPESPGESPAGDHTDTFLVTYLQGTPVPPAGRLAAGTLACELAKLQCGDKSCRLPKRASTVAREGVTIVMPLDDEMFSRGTTGIWEIDRFLASTQHENRTGYRVSSPDYKPYRRAWQ